MKLRYCAFAVLMLGWGMSVMGQGLPDELITGAALSPSDNQTIQKFVADQAAKLANAAAPADQTSARELLVAQVYRNPKVSAPFIAGYAEALNAGLLPLTKSPDMRSRLNAAIVVAKIADKAESTALMECTQAFLNDETEPVILWGLRAAKSVVPAIYRNAMIRADNKVVPAVEKALQKHPSGWIAAEAYDTMTLGLYASGRQPSREMLDLALPVMQRLLAVRLDLYQRRPITEPSAEQEPARFLPDSRVWKGKPAEDMVSVQLLADLLSLAAQQLANNPQKKEEFWGVVSKTAGAFTVIAGQANINDSKLLNAAQPLTRGAQPPAGVQQDVERVLAAVKANPNFAQLKPSPVYRIDAAKVAPASAPAATTTAAE